MTCWDQSGRGHAMAAQLWLVVPGLVMSQGQSCLFTSQLVRFTFPRRKRKGTCVPDPLCVHMHVRMCMCVRVPACRHACLGGRTGVCAQACLPAEHGEKWKGGS